MTIAKYGMLKYDDRIAVAVSGGKDSLSLLQVLAKIEESYPQASLIAISVDEGIQQYSDKNLKIASEKCKKLGIEHYTVSFEEAYGWTQDEIVSCLDQGEENGVTPCTFCNILRNKILNIAAREVEAEKIATAQTLDDETQATLLNILHGDVFRIVEEKPVTGKARPKSVHRIKPFCEIPERETTLYAYIKELRSQDLSCPYSSEEKRDYIRLFLNRMEHKHVGTKFTIFKSMQRIRSVIEKTSSRVELSECSECGERSAQNTCKACQMLRRFKRKWMVEPR